jgi:hypothetical protein
VREYGHHQSVPSVERQLQAKKYLQVSRTVQKDIKQVIKEVCNIQASFFAHIFFLKFL